MPKRIIWARVRFTRRTLKPLLLLQLKRNFRRDEFAGYGTMETVICNGDWMSGFTCVTHVILCTIPYCSIRRRISQIASDWLNAEFEKLSTLNLYRQHFIWRTCSINSSLLPLNKHIYLLNELISLSFLLSDFLFNNSVTGM